MGLLEQLLMAERENDHLFVTLSHLVFGPDQRSVRVLRAGHPGLLLRTPGHVDLVEGPAGPAVGLESGGSWPEQELPLPPDSGLVLFTDGLFEGRVGPGSQRLGEEGLLAMARGLAMLPPADFVDTLLDRTGAAAAPYGGLADDVAIVHLGWKAAP
jgi:serine phosphatase RsbU (regulator of sigma subunit)